MKKNTTTVLVILVFGTFLSFLNQTLMNVALPSIMTDFNISASTGQWLTNGYLLISGIMVPATAFLIDRFKTRTLYLTVMTLFTLGTFICGIADSFTILIIGRMIQALGAGVMGPLLTVVIMRLFPMNKRGSAMGIIGLAMNFAPAIGPTLSGWIVQNLNWRYLFLLMMPFLLINLLLAFFKLTNIGEPQDIHLHVPSILLSSFGLGSLLLGFSNAGINDWLTFNVSGFIFIGLILIALFVWMQNKIETPVLNIKVFKYTTFTLATIANFFIIMGLYGGMLLLPLFLQNIRHESPMNSGLVLLPGALIMAALSPVAGNWYDKYGYRVLSTVGLFFLAFGTFFFILIDQETSLWLISFYQIIRCIGLALVLMPIQTEAMNALPKELISHGNAMYNTIRQVAGSIGTATLITLMSRATSRKAQSVGSQNIVSAEIYGIHVAYLAIFILTTVAFFMILLFKNKKNVLNPL